MSDRVREAVEIAREHLEWAGKHWRRRRQALAALGLLGLEDIRRDRHAVRIAALAAAWLSLGIETVPQQKKTKKAA